jgi:ABC-type sugar transport system ATPase subunit
MYIDMKNITMMFDSTRALDNVDFSLNEGEIHGLMGENGAGKSTLMNILGGVLRPTSGKVYFNGEDITNLDEKKAFKLGIRFIHQELNLVNDLKVYENLFLGEEVVNRFGVTNRKYMRKRAAEVLQSVNLGSLSPDTMVGELDTSHKQLIEIAKSLLFEAKVIIMDEPTTALSDTEITKLFDIMRQLKAKGVSMIYISHKMPELFKICDRFTVLRDGKCVGTGSFKEINEDEATTMLVGQHIRDHIDKEAPSEDVVLKAEKLSCEGYFKDVSFELHKGEVLIFTGLQGDGRGELAEALFGARKLTGGTVTLEGKPVKFKSIKSTMRSGIGMVQRNRKERSIIKDMNVLDNLTIAQFVYSKKHFVIRRRDQMRVFEDCRNMLDVKVGSPKHEITSLSGGNQQKVIISRWLELKSKVYIFDNPTQGVDVGAKFEIYKLISKLSEEGVSVIVFSSEYPEIAKIGDRCIVMYCGQITKEFERKDFNEAAIMYYATGSDRKAV